MRPPQLVMAWSATRVNRSQIPSTSVIDGHNVTKITRAAVTKYWAGHISLNDAATFQILVALGHYITKLT